MTRVRDWMKPNQRMATEFLELLEEKLAYYHKEFPSIYDLTDDVAEFLLREIRKEFDVIKRETKGRYLFLSEDASYPNCRGCFNEFGGCGTPCTICEDADTFDKDWEILIWVPNKFRIFERKNHDPREKQSPTPMK